MLEVFALIALCKKNRANARARGKSVGGITALTICLWAGMETFGIILCFILFGADTNQYVAALVGLLFAGIGGLISFFCSKIGHVVDQPPMTGAFTNINLSSDSNNNGYTAANNGVSAVSQPQAATTFMNGLYCPMCGQYNDSTSSFCGFCGTKIR